MTGKNICNYQIYHLASENCFVLSELVVMIWKLNGRDTDHPVQIQIKEYVRSETEEHFVLFCPKYKDLRRIMFQEIMRGDPNIQSITHNDRFVYLMCSQNLSTIKAVMIFLNSATKERKSLLSGQSINILNSR